MDKFASPAAAIHRHGKGRGQGFINGGFSVIVSHTKEGVDDVV